MKLAKFLPYLVSESTPLSMAEKLRATFAAFVATLVVGLVSSQFLQGSGAMIAPNWMIVVAASTSGFGKADRKYTLHLIDLPVLDC